MDLNILSSKEITERKKCLEKSEPYTEDELDCFELDNMDPNIDLDRVLATIAYNDLYNTPYKK